MPRRHPRPGEDHARQLKEAQEKALAEQRASDLFGFLVDLAERGIRGPYRIGDNLLCLLVQGADSGWVCEGLTRLKPLLLPLCRTPVQDGLSVGLHEID